MCGVEPGDVTIDLRDDPEHSSDGILVDPRLASPLLLEASITTPRAQAVAALLKATPRGELEALLGGQVGQVGFPPDKSSDRSSFVVEWQDEWQAGEERGNSYSHCNSETPSSRGASHSCEVASTPTQDCGNNMGAAHGAAAASTPHGLAAASTPHGHPSVPDRGGVVHWPNLLIRGRVFLLYYFLPYDKSVFGRLSSVQDDDCYHYYYYYLLRLITTITYYYYLLLTYYSRAFSSS